MSLEKSIDFNKKQISIDIPLTSPSGKVRIKKRSMFYEYGLPHASRQKPFEHENYVEWQIGYDSNSAEETTLKSRTFLAYNGKRKYLCELTEYLYYFYTWGLFQSSELKNVFNELTDFGEKDLLSNHEDAQIDRTHPIDRSINNVPFLKITLKYPQFVHKFGEFEILAEITIREQQRAVGIQPMLYLCFPISELLHSERLIGRTAEKKETARFVLDENNCQIVIQLVKIFGMLSPSHQSDVLEMLKLVLEHD